MTRVVQDQSEVLTFLREPTTYGRAGSILRIDTDGAIVFLAGPDVYKVKRALRADGMDFSTLARRQAACEAEVVVNRVNAPGLYLGVVPVTRDGAGLSLGGAGVVIEWTVHLRRFDETTTFERLAAEGPLGSVLIDALAQAVATAHRKAPIKDGTAATGVLRDVVRSTTTGLADAIDTFPPKRAREFGVALISAFDVVESMLLRRGMQGQVRRCHGDLHLGNVALIDGAPVLFDALESDDSIATCDVLYDLAYLLMDLAKVGSKADAALLLVRYIVSEASRPLLLRRLAEVSSTMA